MLRAVRKIATLWSLHLLAYPYFCRCAYRIGDEGEPLPSFSGSRWDAFETSLSVLHAMQP